jgi:hypothetical protein
MLLAACSSSNSSGDGGTDADSDSDTDGDTDSETETETETDTDSLLPTPECAEDGDCQAPLICNELWGLCVVATCAEQDDFVPCEVVTDPDRAYDICIRGVCQSPGCGTVDCNPPGPHFPLGDSNQRYCCGDDGGNWGSMGGDILDECPAPGEDYYGQDAQFGWDTLHDHSERFTRTVPVPDEPIVEDHVTGLIWQGCRSKFRGADCEIEIEEDMWQWKHRLAYCDSLVWGGYHDWRLPDRWELESLVQEAEFYPNCDQEAFPRCESDSLWANSKSAEETSEWGSAFVVGLYNGGIWSDGIYDGASARCVRGVPNRRPQARWELDTSVPHQPLVRDHWTGLVWQGCPKGLGGDDCEMGSLEKTQWTGALDYCAFLSELSWGGRDDWRLPSRHELSTIVDDRFISPALDAEAFPPLGEEYKGGGTWTSTSIPDYTTEALWARSMLLFDGGFFNGGKNDKFLSREVRCVASGQW